MALEDIVQAIIRMEGHPSPYPGTNLYNAGNLTWAHQAGAAPVASGGVVWAGWTTYAASVEGVRRDIKAKARVGMTLHRAIEVYAPKSDGNDTGAYIAFVAKQSGYDPSVLLSDVITGKV